MSKIKFELPGKETPGYLRRMKNALEYAKMLQDNPSPATIDALVEFLLPYVIEPEDRKEARNALWDATQEQFDSLLGAIVGKSDSENPTPPKENE